jgi:hypothetical protein
MKKCARPIERLGSADAATEAALKTCSLACRAVVAYYLNEKEARENDFGRCLLRTAAAIDAAAAALDADPHERHATFAIAAPICRAATARCRHAGFDPLVFKAAAACERAAAICEGDRL